MGFRDYHSRTASGMQQMGFPHFACSGALLWAGLLILSLLPGCSRLQVPAIDPTGTCIFSPSGQSTTLTPLSCLSCDKCCLGGEGCSCFSCLKNILPEPAFAEPATPPPCLEGNAPGAPGCTNGFAQGNGACQDECAVGPPAILLGKDCCVKNHLHMPKTGTRGRLMLSPGRVIAPVGGEVVLLSGVCGNNGHLVTGEPIEWMLTPESVGHFIQVAPDDANFVQRLANTSEVEKVTPSFARGITRTKAALITRGTLTPNDDVPLEAGQAWVTISSPSEGVSRITALAPDSNCWDQRKATTTIYWVDARWQFPGPQSAAAGSPVTLTTRVTRSEGTVPAVGWKVRYNVLNPELGLFAPSGTPTAEAIVDDNGLASVAIVPQPGTSGTATIQMEVIRPAQVDDNIPALPLGARQTIVTWSAPRLELKASAPNVAGFDQPISVIANVSNPGNLNSGRVEVETTLPPTVQFLGSDFTHQQLGNRIVWIYENGIPAGVQGDINLSVSARNPFVLQFVARDLQNGLTATSDVRVDVARPSLAVRVQPTEETQRITVGEDAVFLIEVENTGDRPLEQLMVEARGDIGMIQVQAGSQTVSNTRPTPLAPGESWQLQVPYNVFQPGERCLTATATATGQTPTSAQACVIAVNPVPVAPSLVANIAGMVDVPIGQQVLFRYFVQNTGSQPATNVVLTATFPPQLQLISATQGYDSSALQRAQIKWTQPRLEPGQSAFFEGLYSVIGPVGSGQTLLTIQSDEGVTADKGFTFNVIPGAAPPPEPAPAPRNITPSGPPPTIPPAAINPPTPRRETPAPGPVNDGSTMAPPSLQGNNGIAAGGLQVQVFDNGDPVRVGQELVYTIRVTNQSTQRDDNVQVRLKLRVEAGVNISQPETPGLTFDRVVDNYYYLPEIRSIAPGQTITYYLAVSANSPQTQGVLVEAYSRNFPQGTSRTEETQIIPQ